MPNDSNNTAGSDCPSTPCSASSRIEAMKAVRKFQLLATHPHIQPEVIADHYTKLATVAMQLREMVGIRRYHKSSPEMDAAIEKLTKEITEHHLADFGIELSWQNVKVVAPLPAGADVETGSEAADHARLRRQGGWQRLSTHVLFGLCYSWGSNSEMSLIGEV